jgi:3-deoxy-manno-octulosonate cytidylyltransferase (CMP-KDO synthetase)
MAKGKHLCIIPARLLSTRLPGKPLKALGDNSVLKNTWERANDSAIFDTIVIATDDNTVNSGAESFGAQTVHTAFERTSGTERAAEALSSALDQWGEFDTVTILPLSLPTIPPSVLRSLVYKFTEHTGCSTMTPIAPLLDVQSFLDVHTVKTTTNNSSDILAVSRAPIPYALGGYTDEPTHTAPLSWRLIPVTTYSTQELVKYFELPIPTDETREEIDILRMLHAGKVCATFALTPKQATEIIEVSTSESLAEAANVMKQRGT